jgi:cytochrome oxidase Cu insertion factor (SCO1/SenC/PrrC family)
MKVYPKRLVITLKLLLCVIFIHTHVAAKSPGIGGDFQLTSHLGEPFSLQDIRGKVAILFFGFTHCPDVCPSTLLDIQRLLVNLGDQADEVSVLFVSVDPKRDTPEKLASYVQYFNKNIIGLTGTNEQIRSVLERYNSSAKIDGSGDHYTVEHTANLFLINRQGDLSSIILPRTPHSVFEQQVRKLIEQP